MATAQVADQAQAAEVELEAATNAAGEESLVVEELLVEEVSIDGMCGVY
ncbi:MAG: mycofactocin precursor MftA [Microthrixaceae bacterium]